MSFSLRRQASAIDWRRHPTVVIESDDWGFCAWVPDEEAFRGERSVLPDFRRWHIAGTEDENPYFGSTLESAEDVRRLAEILGRYRGSDGRPVVFQPNYIMACPDFEAIEKSGFAELVTEYFPDYSGRWHRPGLMEAVREAMGAGVWIPEYHGYLHINPDAWLALAAKGEPNTRRMFDEGIVVNDTDDDEYEFDGRIPVSRQAEFLSRGVRRFEEVFGYSPRSIIPPDNYWTDNAERLFGDAGLQVVQSWRSQKTAKRPHSRSHRIWRKLTRPVVHYDKSLGLTYLSRNAHFEPSGRPDSGNPMGATQCLRNILKAWRRGEPAIVSTHRHNFVHLDEAVVEENLRQFDTLLKGVIEAEPKVVFRTDHEIARFHRFGTGSRRP